MEFWYIIEISFLLNIAYRELKSPRWKEEFSNRYSAYFDKFVSTVSVNENILKNANSVAMSFKKIKKHVQKYISQKVDNFLKG